ncbi:MAG: type II toxin-antitoxin system prevent-host-death family antitoxin [Actinomycetota bacterium]
MAQAPQRGAPPLEVGIRELRDHLSSWLDEVKDGNELVITERGRAVARIVPVSMPARYQQLIDRGTITPASRPRRPASELPKIPVRIGIDELIRDQRR